MAEFEINGVTYRSGKINAFDQLAISKRVAPLIAASAMVVKDAGPPLPENAPAEEKTRRAMTMFLPIVDAFSKMSDEDSKFIITTCLSKVSRKRENDTGWVAIWNEAAGEPQFADIDLATMLMVSWEVIQAELSPFGHTILSMFNR